MVHLSPTCIQSFPQCSWQNMPILKCKPLIHGSRSPVLTCSCACRTCIVMYALRCRMHDSCEVQGLDLSVVESDVRLIWKSEIDILEVLGNCWTYSQHLQHSPSTVLHVELLQRFKCSRCPKSVQVGRF